MQKVIVEGFPLADVSINIVWIDMLAPDSEATARVSAKIVEDPRVRHFHDPEKRVGKAIAQSLGGQDKIAWDMYLFYTRGSEWDARSPTPTNWVHQLQGATWADPARCHCGSDLVKELHKATGELIDPQQAT